MRIDTGRTDRASDLRSEEPVQNSDDRRIKNECQRNRLAKHRDVRCKRHLMCAGRNGLIGLSHDIQVNRVQGDLCQNSGQDVRNSHHRVKNARHKSRDNAADKCNKKCRERIHAPEDHHGADTAAERKRAVAGHIREVQDAECQIHAECHNTPDQALCQASRHSIPERHRTQG